LNRRPGYRGVVGVHPPLIVWFGIGELPTEVLIAFGITPNMTIATVATLDEVPEDLGLPSSPRRCSPPPAVSATWSPRRETS
jgi:hypothetical protein